MLKLLLYEVPQESLIDEGIWVVGDFDETDEVVMDLSDLGMCHCMARVTWVTIYIWNDKYIWI